MTSQTGRTFKRLSHLIWILVVFLLAGCEERRSAPPFHPDIEGLKLVRLITGDDAIKAINELHGKPINVVQGFVANYEGVGDKATIWGSEAFSQELAKEQITAMIHLMKENRRSPFSRYRMLELQGLKVFAFDGLGQLHYLFGDYKWVYWISADPTRMDKIMNSLGKSR